jgi:hypothetical protein
MVMMGAGHLDMQKRGIVYLNIHILGTDVSIADLEVRQIAHMQPQAKGIITSPYRHPKNRDR